MNEKEITVLMVEPGKHPVITTLKNDLNAMQKAVSIGADYQDLIELVELERGVARCSPSCRTNLACLSAASMT